MPYLLTGMITGSPTPPKSVGSQGRPPSSPPQGGSQGRRSPGCVFFVGVEACFLGVRGPAEQKKKMPSIFVLGVFAKPFYFGVAAFFFGVGKHCFLAWSSKTVFVGVEVSNVFFRR